MLTGREEIRRKAIVVLDSPQLFLVHPPNASLNLLGTCWTGRLLKVVIHSDPACVSGVYEPDMAAARPAKRSERLPNSGDIADLQKVDLPGGIGLH